MTHVSHRYRSAMTEHEPTAHVVVCADCSAQMHLVRGVHGLFYGCTRFPECNGRHSAHRDGTPMGVPADFPTRQARIAAHAAFDRLWKGGRMRRKAAYLWLQHALQLSAQHAHIGRLDAPTCERVVQLVDAYLGAEYQCTDCSESFPDLGLAVYHLVQTGHGYQHRTYDPKKEPLGHGE